MSTGKSSALQNGNPSGASQPGAVQGCPLKQPHWIEVVLVDEAGKPVADEAYLIVGPDGTEYSGNLDANGYVRIDPIQPGQCKVSFPEIDQHQPFRR